MTKGPGGRAVRSATVGRPPRTVRQAHPAKDPPMTMVAPHVPAPAPAVELSVDASVDLAVARLAAEFADRLQPQLIQRVVRNCRRDLGGSPVGALPELVERLARHRLQECVA